MHPNTKRPRATSHRRGHGIKGCALTQVESKPCRRCGVVHPLSNFHNDKRRPDGKVDWCKDCRRAYRAEVYARDPQAAIDYQREWKRRNPHKVTEYGRRFRHGVEPDEFEALKAASTRSICSLGRRGGWDVAADLLGLRVLGVEIDDAACATREAAGHATLRADVALLDPRDHPARGLIGSPPCPTFSAAGNGAGRALTAILVGCAKRLPMAATLATRRGPRRCASCSPASGHRRRRLRSGRRAASATRPCPSWSWSRCGGRSRTARSGSPSNRSRPCWSSGARSRRSSNVRATGAGRASWKPSATASLRPVSARSCLARSDGQPHPPAPTHQRYVPGEAQRHDVTLEGEIRPWVSMAEALGWHGADRMRSNYNDGSTGERGAAGRATSLRLW
jgi:hypothetical protein